MSGKGRWRVPDGSALDRERVIQFRFNGKRYQGYAGDTLASALLANGVRLFGRSFKFHRPRGVFTCGVEEPNAFVQVDEGIRSIPSSRATGVELYEGLKASVPMGWPSLGFDVGRVLDFTAPLWPAGFYNKTFMWPSWHPYERFVRAMAGFGRAPSGADPDRYERHNLHCDVLIIGGGVSGLKAAFAAADAGSRVILAEQGTELGGRSLWDRSEVDGAPESVWVRAAVTRLAQLPDVRALTRTTATGYYEHGVVVLSQTRAPNAVQAGEPRERLFVVRAQHVEIAAGAIEQPLIYCNNDRPGIMLAGAVRQYLRRFGVVVGRRIVIATNNDSVYPLAYDLKAVGVHVVAVVDSREEVASSSVETLRTLRIPLLTRSIPVETAGFSALSGVSIGRLTRDLSAVESTTQFACDGLAVSGGWNPTLHLYSHARGRMGYAEGARTLAPAVAHPVVNCHAPEGESGVGIRVSPIGSPHRQWVDLRHDVTVADLQLALREGYSSIEHVKRYTTVGMAADQGKTSNLAALDIVAQDQHLRPADVGHTTFRPPFTPLTLGAIAGREIGERFSPTRQLPMHDWHVSHQAVLEDYGVWKRPSVYCRPGEARHQATRREARAVRSGVALMDSSSLGKIEIRGPDALEFVDRFYINNLKMLPLGRLRYGIMLRESGVLFDDGTIVTIAPDHLLVTTTSANSGRVYSWLDEWHQCDWPNLRVALSLVTDQWAVVSLTGPQARHILSRLEGDIDLSNGSFPHLTMREGRLLHSPARIYRVSFTGELTYEINVPARHGPAVWEALWEAGQSYGIEAFGLDALALLRLEKGFLHIGTDTDGTTIPGDVGWGQVASSKAADFVGKRSLQLPEHRRADRLQLVGLRAEGPIVVGSHLRLAGSSEATDGWVTSAGASVIGDEPIALALLRAGRQKVGREITVHDENRVTTAKVVNPVFYDDRGERMRA